MKVFLFAAFSAFLTAAPVCAQENDSARDVYTAGRDLEASGRITEAENYYNEAVRICTRLIQSGSATMDTYAVLTWSLQRQKKYTDVVMWGERALRIQNDYRIIETMGEAHFYLKNFPAALKNMEIYTANMSNGDRASVAYFFIGEIYRIERKYRYADIAYTAAVQLEPGMALWWYRLGTVRESTQDFSYAAEAFKRALKINPSYSDALEGLNRLRKVSA
ncbi:MAG: tetratricopeptide repeat protein [Spirochaetaceae bacterium]|jgi:tetratricopeptide (TPR) repeat protein|nr:tetratricopeptide repeat protein [Spirochaetaceae bacterium]